MKNMFEEGLACKLYMNDSGTGYVEEKKKMEKMLIFMRKISELAKG